MQIEATVKPSNYLALSQTIGRKSRRNHHKLIGEHFHYQLQIFVPKGWVFDCFLRHLKCSPKMACCSSVHSFTGKRSPVQSGISIEKRTGKDLWGPGKPLPVRQENRVGDRPMGGKRVASLAPVCDSIVYREILPVHLNGVTKILCTQHRGSGLKPPFHTVPYCTIILLHYAAGYRF